MMKHYNVNEVAEAIDIPVTAWAGNCYCPFSRDLDPEYYCAHPDMSDVIPKGGYGPPPAECPLRSRSLLLELKRGA